MTDLDIGPVLRGLSAVTRAGGTNGAGPGGAGSGEATGRPAGAARPASHASSHAATVGPGSLFRLLGRDAPSAPGGGADPAAAPPLHLTSVEDTAAVAADWHRYVEYHAAEPEVVVLPAGARWVRTQAAPARVTTGAYITPEEIAGGVRGRVAVVTGAAQGFGLEIARGLASLGAVVALADLNLEGARERAADLGAPHAAFAVNVTDEESVRALIAAVTREYGGIDIVVSNAGVLKAGSVKELELKDFRFVTDVNYIGFFLMTKHASPVMALQAEGAAAANSVRLAPGSTGAANRGAGSGDGAAVMPWPAPYLTDIIEINSKSGLVGSNKNAAYAGSKFGGIGLVQSFALELVEQGTKVNAICPGNYLDGPLWSDPERGLFVQYLRAGKVPGATTIEEVRRFYEGKVPMKRGCTGADVVRAIAYVVGQQYETGQAVPVTGGQVMLA